MFFFPLQSKKALKNILQMCTYLPALEPLLFHAPSNILKHVVGQFSKVSIPIPPPMFWYFQISHQVNILICLPLPSKVLPRDGKARHLFVKSGGLKKVLEIQAEPGSLLQEHLNTINSCFPDALVRCGSLTEHTQAKTISY